jgi:glyoxylase-like metal-dependent hydrolase (beta-lactamase superfamily II)
MIRTTASMTAVGILALAGASAQAERASETATTTMNENEVTIRADHVAGSVYVITGRGGNIAISVGDDGVFMIDDQYAPLTPAIRAVIGRLTDQPIRFVLNTHWHSDHTGGNESLGETGSLIVAHDNVRKRMSTDQVMAFWGREIEAAPPGALPVVTFSEAVTFHFNDDTIHARHYPNAHTDGDAVVYFENSDVIHLGDIYWNGAYPFIDTGSGGSIRGMIGAIDAVLPRLSPGADVIAGHGKPTSSRVELKAYRDMLETVADRIQAGIDAGKSLEALQAEKPTAEWDEGWGGGFVDPETWVRMVYEDLKR